MQANEFKTKQNIKPFNGDKYTIWKFRIRALIAEEDALKVIDEDIPDEITDEWRKCERIAKGILIEHLSDSMIGFATESESAKSIFHKMDQIYERKNLATQLALEKKLLSLKLKQDCWTTKLN